MTEGSLHIERWHIPLGDVLSLHLDGADLARLVEARVVGNTLVIDMEGEAHARVERSLAQARPVAKETPAPGLVHPNGADEAGGLDDVGPGQPADSAPVPDEPKHENASQEATTEPELKGGPLARQAAIACQDGAMRIFLVERHAVEASDDIGAMLCACLGIASRRLLDHDPVAAQRWRELKREYDLWMAMP